MKTKQSKQLTLFDNLNSLTKSSTSNQIKAYFQKVLELKQSGEKFPVDLEEVWPLAYTEKRNAVRELKGNFTQGVDYQPLLQNEQQKNNGSGGHNKVTYKLSVPCMEHFVARKSTPVFEVYRKVFHHFIEEEMNPDLKVDRAIAGYQRKGKSAEWISKRLEGKLKRNEFTTCLVTHGVKGNGFKNCTNAIYKPLYGGEAAVVREKKHLPDHVSLRDNMSEIELDAVKFAESLSKYSIEKNNFIGNRPCESACERSATAVANSVVQALKAA